MTSCRYCPCSRGRFAVARRRSLLRIDRAGTVRSTLDGRVVEDPLDQPAGRDHVVERANRSVEPEMDSRDRGRVQRLDVDQGPASRCRMCPGIRPRTRSNGTARTTKSAAIASPVRKTTPLIAPSSSASMALTPVVRRTVTSWSRSQRCQPGSVKLTQRNQGNLRLKARPVPQEPVQEHLAGVTDIHLFEPLIQGRDEHGGPEQVDRSAALAVPEQPVGERLARPVVARDGQRCQAVRNPQLVAGAQESGRQKTAGQVERGRPGPRPKS